MSAAKIAKALMSKGLTAEVCEYVRGEPTPGGVCNYWLVRLDEESEVGVLEKNSNANIDPDTPTLKDVLEWIDELPDCCANCGGSGWHTEHDNSGVPIGDSPCDTCNPDGDAERTRTAGDAKGA